MFDFNMFDERFCKKMYSTIKLLENFPRTIQICSP